MKDTLRTLIVDDDDNMAHTLVKILRTKGYQAEAAHTGEQALALAQAKSL